MPPAWTNRRIASASSGLMACDIGSSSTLNSRVSSAPDFSIPLVT